MTDNIIGTKIVIDSNQAVQSVGSIKKQLREATQDLVAMADKFGEGSQQAINAAKRVAELRDRIGDAKSMADAFNPDAKFRAFSQSLQGVAGGFAAVQGAMATFGIESEDLQQTLVKVQGALALSEGLNTFLDTGIQGFKNLISVIQNSTVVTKAQDFATKAASATMKLFGIEVEATSTAFKVLEGAIIATGIGLLVVALGEAVAQFDKFQNSAKGAADAQKELNRQIVAQADYGLKGQNEFLEAEQKNQIARLKASGASEAKIFETEQLFRKLKLNDLQKYYDEIKSIDALKSNDILGEINRLNKEISTAQFVFEATERRRRNEEYIKKFKERKESEKIEAESIRSIGFEEKNLNKLKIYHAGISAKITDSNIDLAYREAEAKRKAYGDIAGALGMLAGVAEQGSDLQKGLALAQVAIDTGIAISNLTATSTAPTPDNLVTGGISGFAKYAVGIAKILANIATARNIIKTSNHSSGSYTSVPTGSNAPVYPTMQTQNTITTLNQGTINALGNQAIKAYVLESDVTNSQGRVTRILNSSRFK